LLDWHMTPLQQTLVLVLHVLLILRQLLLHLEDLHARFSQQSSVLEQLLPEVLQSVFDLFPSHFLLEPEVTHFLEQHCHFRRFTVVAYDNNSKFQTTNEL